jgi:hypothetical protein
MISRIDALRTGRKRFYVGKPCIRGHFAERYTTSGSCVECQLSRPVQRCRALLVGDLPPPRVAGHCDLCEKPARLKRDFDRALVERGFPTLECYRGWLCVSCKIGLSQIGDTPRALRKALRYVSGQLTGTSSANPTRKVHVSAERRIARDMNEVPTAEMGEAAFTGGQRGSGSSSAPNVSPLGDRTSTLTDIGIDKNRASRTKKRGEG